MFLFSVYMYLFFPLSPPCLLFSLSHLPPSYLYYFSLSRSSPYLISLFYPSFLPLYIYSSLSSLLSISSYSILHSYLFLHSFFSYSLPPLLSPLHPSFISFLEQPILSLCPLNLINCDLCCLIPCFPLRMSSASNPSLLVSPRQGTVSELLSKPKCWDKLTEKGRDSYRKMHAWATDENAIFLLKSLIPKKGEY